MKNIIFNTFKIAALTIALTATVNAANNNAMQETIVDKAVGAPELSTLVKALQAANLVDTLNGTGPFTVFAPTDEAFNKLPAGTLDSLLKDKAKLTKVLTYHVIPGKVMAADVKDGKVKTVEGQDITLEKNSQGVMVNNAKVVKADINASNGVIHEIDTVLLPPAK